MLPLGFAAFWIFGVALVLVGSNQADLARDLGLDLAGSGLLMSALILGIGVGVLGSGPLVDRHARRPLFIGASLLAAASLLLFDHTTTFARAFTQVSLVGVGLGVYETLLAATIGELYRERSARPLVFVHAAATAAGMLAPAAIGWIAEHGHWTTSFRITGAGHLALAAWALAVRFPAPPRAGATGGERPALSLALLPFAIVGFTYVGVESAITILAVPYATGALGLAEANGRLAISAFWAGLLAGRLAILALRARIDARYLVGAGIGGALVLAAGVGVRAGHPAIVFAACGAAMGFVFPVLIALAGDRFPDARGTTTGLVTGAAALGGFAIPWLHGAVGDLAGPALALGSLCVWTLVLAAAAWAARPGEPT